MADLTLKDLRLKNLTLEDLTLADLVVVPFAIRDLDNKNESKSYSNLWETEITRTSSVFFPKKRAFLVECLCTTLA